MKRMSIDEQVADKLVKKGQEIKGLDRISELVSRQVKEVINISLEKCVKQNPNKEVPVEVIRAVVQQTLEDAGIRDYLVGFIKADLKDQGIKVS